MNGFGGQKVAQSDGHVFVKQECIHLVHDVTIQVEQLRWRIQGRFSQKQGGEFRHGAQLNVRRCQVQFVFVAVLFDLFLEKANVAQGCLPHTSRLPHQLAKIGIHHATQSNVQSTASRQPFHIQCLDMESIFVRRLINMPFNGTQGSL